MKHPRNPARSTRRDFMRQTSGLAAGALVAGARPLDTQRGGALPSARTSALMTTFGLKYPIFCAGMGGPAGPDLAIAVSNAGGLGGIGGGVGTADVVRGRVARTKAGTHRPFAINYLLARG